jgi:hypothetical protein
MTLKGSRFYFTAYVLIIIFMVGCATTANSIVQLSREKYVSQVNPKDYKMFRGRRILFSSIIDKSTNTSNLAYYNPERTIGYQLYYTLPLQGMPQPVVSFFWYALQKGFDHAGIIIEESAPFVDIELTMILRSVTDKEINFDVFFTRMGRLIYEKNYLVKTPYVQTTNNFVLEQRAYGMIDSMIKTILDDPNFKKMFLK